MVEAYCAKQAGDNEFLSDLGVKRGNHLVRIDGPIRYYLLQVVILGRVVQVDTNEESDVPKVGV
jgi:hypothetical protein